MKYSDAIREVLESCDKNKLFVSRDQVITAANTIYKTNFKQGVINKLWGGDLQIHNGLKDLVSKLIKEDK